MSTAHQQSSHGAFIFVARSFLGMDLALRFASLRSPIVVGKITSCRASNAKHAYNIDTPRAVDSRVLSTNRPAFGKIQQVDYSIGKIVLASMGQRLCGGSV